MLKKSISIICRDNGLDSKKVFQTFLWNNLLYKQSVGNKTYNYLTHKGEFFGGEYCYGDDGCKWAVWDEDFVVKFISHVDICSDFVWTMDHMTHIDNLEKILSKGLLPHGNRFQKVDISNSDVNSRRSHQEPIYNRPIHDYVPFYFNPRNAMLYHNKNIQDEIVILGFDSQILLHKKAIYTDGNAAKNDTLFYDDFEEYVTDFDKNSVFSKSWFGDKDLGSKMMSELLLPGRVDISLLQIIFCKTKEMTSYVRSNYNLPNVDVMHEERLFF